MTSQYTKAPTFVSNHSDNMAIIQDYDKELQRINQDYANTNQAISKFRNNIDIVKMNSKNYFDAKYNSVVGQFGNTIDLTKRNQIYKVEGMLQEVTKDPIINNAIISTKNLRKITDLRNTLKSNPKYQSINRSADEYQEEKIKNEYLTNPDLNSSFNLTAPIITMDADKHYQSLIKDIPFEDKIDSNGIVNVFSKVKTFDKISGTLYNEMGKNTNVIAAERNNFDYLYKTPEEKQKFAESFKASKSEYINNINKQLLTLASAYSVNKHPNVEISAIQLAQLKNQEASLIAQKQLLSNNSADPFQLYLLNKSFANSKNSEVIKDIKVQLDPQKKFFTENSHWDQNFKLNTDKFNFDKDYKRSMLELKADEINTKKTKEGFNINPNSLTPDGGVVSRPFTIEAFTTEQNSIAKENSRLGREVVDLLYNQPGPELNSIYNRLTSKGLIKIGRKDQLFSDSNLEQLYKIKDELNRNQSTQPLNDTSKLFIDKVEQIRVNNSYYRLQETLHRLAIKDSGYNGDPSMFNGGFFDSKESNEYKRLAQAYTTRNDEFKSVPISGLNDKYSKEKGASLRTEIMKAVNNGGLTLENGEQLRTSHTFGGSTKNLGEKNIMSDETYNSIKWEDSISSVVIKNGKPMVKLELVPKNEKDGIKKGEQVGTIVYVDVNKSLAQDLLLSTGNKISIDQLVQSSSIYNILSRTNDISVDKANNILSDKHIMSVPVTNFGDIPAKYHVRMMVDRSYLVSVTINGINLNNKIVTNPDDYIKSLQEKANIFKQQLEVSNAYNPKAFITGLSYLNDNLKNL